MIRSRFVTSSLVVFLVASDARADSKPQGSPCPEPTSSAEASDVAPLAVTVSPPRRMPIDPVRYAPIRRSLRGARAELILGGILLQATAASAMFAVMFGSSYCYDYDFDGYGEPSTTCSSGDDSAVAWFGTFAGIGAAAGIPLVLHGGIRLHRAKRDRRLLLRPTLGLASPEIGTQLTLRF